MTDAENNKQTVIAYYNMAFNERKPAEAAQKYGGASLHPAQPGRRGRAGSLHRFRYLAARRDPHMTLDIKRVLAEGDMVVTHSHTSSSSLALPVEPWPTSSVWRMARLSSTGMSCSPSRRARRTTTPCSDHPTL